MNSILLALIGIFGIALAAMAQSTASPVESAGIIEEALAFVEKSWLMMLLIFPTLFGIFRALAPRFRRVKKPERQSQSE